jgi:putative DNA primase/helicase
MERPPLRDRARGLWPQILPAIGIGSSYLTGKNGPCPLCPNHGKDRWRFLNTDGDGTWVCSQCGPGSSGVGSGIELVKRFRGVPFKDAATMIEAVIGTGELRPHPPRPRFDPRAGLNALWRAARPVKLGDPVDAWLRRRGIGLESYPQALRTGWRVKYTDDGTWHPAMLAMVTGPDGKPTTIHRTYLTADGQKAPVEKVRKLYSTVAKGAAIRLTPPASILGVAEGIETALSATKLHGIPTWSVICADMLAAFEPPADVTELVVFADNDVNGTGERAADWLDRRIGKRIKIAVRTPPEAGTDWNDVLLGRK